MLAITVRIMPSMGAECTQEKQAWHPLYCHPAWRQCTAVHHGLGQQWGSRVSEGFCGAEPIKCSHLIPERACHCGCHALPREQDVEPAHHPQQVQQPLEECAPPLTCLCSAASQLQAACCPSCHVRCHILHLALLAMIHSASRQAAVCSHAQAEECRYLEPVWGCQDQRNSSKHADLSSLCAMQLDLPLLTKEHERKPGDTRVVFYLAQTLDLVEDLPAALHMYQKRIDMGGWQQEVFEAHMRRVRQWQRATCP